jgi:hypothetical protein
MAEPDSSRTLETDIRRTRAVNDVRYRIAALITTEHMVELASPGETASRLTEQQIYA